MVNKNQKYFNVKFKLININKFQKTYFLTKKNKINKINNFKKFNSVKIQYKMIQHLIRNNIIKTLIMTYTIMS